MFSLGAISFFSNLLQKKFFFWLQWVFVAAQESFIASLVVACGLHRPMACGLLVPQPGIEPTSPASMLQDRFFFFFLQDRFLTTGPPGKFLLMLLLATEMTGNITFGP